MQHFEVTRSGTRHRQSTQSGSGNGKFHFIWFALDNRKMCSSLIVYKYLFLRFIHPHTRRDTHSHTHSHIDTTTRDVQYNIFCVSSKTFAACGHAGECVFLVVGIVWQKEMLQEPGKNHKKGWAVFGVGWGGATRTHVHKCNAISSRTLFNWVFRC